MKQPDNASATYYVTDNHTSSDNGSNAVDYNFSSDGKDADDLDQRMQPTTLRPQLS